MLSDREAAMRATLIELRARVEYWTEDRASNLLPTETSLRNALAKIDAALAKGEERRVA